MLVGGGALLIFPIMLNVKHIFPPVAIILMAEGILHFPKLYLNFTNKLFLSNSLNFKNAVELSHLSQKALNNMTTTPLWPACSSAHVAES